VDVINNPAINIRIEIVEGLATPGFKNVSISLKAFLGGAYSADTGEMNDVLRTSGCIPTAQPFTAKGFTHVAAGETITPSVLIPADATAIVDWVFEEICDGNDPTTVLATKSALVRKSGFLCDVNGHNNMIFAFPEAGNFCVALRHPNHLGFRNTTVTNNDPGTNHFFDMSNGSGALYGTDALWDEGSVFFMISGGGTNDGQVNAVDKNLHWRIENGGIYDYLISTADFNLDGSVNSVDKNAGWRPYNAKIEQLTTRAFIINEQKSSELTVLAEDM
jgi:hypothetical protein